MDKSYINNYKSRHQHPLNKLCHTIGIPMITIAWPLFFFRWRWALVLFEGKEQIQKGIGRNAKPADSMAQGDQDGMARLAVVTAEQFLAPPLQKGQCFFAAARFVCSASKALESSAKKSTKLLPLVNA